MSSALPRILCPASALSTSFLEAPGERLSVASSAKSLKKYRWGAPGGGHGPPYPGLRKSLFPCREPAGTSVDLATPSGKARSVSGRFQSNQCVHVPPGASGSSMIRQILFVPAGGSVQANAGETSAPSQVYFAAIGSPSLIASDVSHKGTKEAQTGLCR